MIVLRGLAQTGLEVGTEQTLSRSRADQVDHFRVAARQRGHADGNAIVAATDPQIAVMDHDRQSCAGDMPPLAGATESPDRPQQVELVDVTLFGPVHFGQIEEGLVGEIDIGDSFQHAAQNVAGLVAIAATEGQYAAQEFRPHDDIDFGPTGQLLEHQFGLVEHLLREERLADPELRIDGLRRQGIAVDDGRVFRTSHVIPPGVEEVLRQQQLHAGLDRVLHLGRLAVCHEPAAQHLFHIVVVGIRPPHHDPFADEHQQIGRELVAVLVEQSLVGAIGIERHPVVAETVVHRRLQQWGQRTGIVDRQSHAAHPRESLRRQIADRFLAGLVHVGDVRQHAGREHGCGDEVLLGDRSDRER